MESSVDSDQRRIREVLAAYCHRCDDGDFTTLADLFAPEGAFVYRGEVASGRSAVERWFEAAQGRPSQRGRHLTVNTVVDLQGDRAKVLSDFLFLRCVDGTVTPAVVGRYQDDFARVGGQWLIERREVQPFSPSPSHG